jgi:hypothetical protein
MTAGPFTIEQHVADAVTVQGPHGPKPLLTVISA